MLNMVRQVADDLKERQINGISYTRRAMIQNGFSPDVDGVWKTSQLNSELRTIVENNMPLSSKD